MRTGDTVDLLERTRHNIITYRLTLPGDRVLVAVSGGPDSLCLLHVLCCLRQELGIELHVAHLNHGLRGIDADADAAFVQRVAGEWGVPVTIEQADVRAYQRQHKLSLEEAARQVRYDFLRRVAQSIGAVAIATGHTADDQVETIIMHWLRGTGLTGLLGMLPVQDWPGEVRLIRPFLNIERKDIETYCARQGLQPRRDRSNEDEHFWRNRVRHSVLPALERLNPRLRDAILRTARILADEDAYLRQQVRALWPDLVTHDDYGMHVKLDGFQALPVALQRRLLREVWKVATQSYEDLAWTHIEQALALIAGPPGQTLSLPGRRRLYRGYTQITFTTPEGRGGPPPDLPLLYAESMSIPIVVPGTTVLLDSGWSVVTEILPPDVLPGCFQRQTLSEVFDAEVVGNNLLLRQWKTGDRMQPLGMSGTRKVHDIMIDNRIPREWRKKIPLLATDGHILWVVGVRRSEWGKVTETTRRILRISFLPRKEETEEEKNLT